MKTAIQAEPPQELVAQARVRQAGLGPEFQRFGGRDPAPLSVIALLAAGGIVHPGGRGPGVAWPGVKSEAEAKT